MKIFDKDFYRYLALFTEIGLTLFINVFIAIYLYYLLRNIYLGVLFF